VIDERLLYRSFRAQILIHFASMLLPAGECQIEACPALIGVADVTSDPGFYTALTI